LPALKTHRCLASDTAGIAWWAENAGAKGSAPLALLYFNRSWRRAADALFHRDRQGLGMQSDAGLEAA